jgi:hypothetical protein
MQSIQKMLLLPSLLVLVVLLISLPDSYLIPAFAASAGLELKR